MTCHIASLYPSNASTALFRAWASEISASIGAAGWEQGTDTGQIDWDTVLASDASNHAAGFEIWKTADLSPPGI